MDHSEGNGIRSFNHHSLHLGAYISLADALKIGAESHASLRLILYEKETKTTLREFSWEDCETLCIACGPEGGFSGAEVEMARDLGYAPVSLGGRVVQFLSGISEGSVSTSLPFSGCPRSNSSYCF